MRQILIATLLILNIFAIGQNRVENITISGFVKNSNDLPMTKASVILLDVCENKITSTSRNDGSFYFKTDSICFPLIIRIESPRCYAKTVKIKSLKAKTDTSFIINLDSIVGGYVYCPFVSFKKNKARLNKLTKSCLSELQIVLVANPRIKIKIIGCQDKTEKENINSKRANNVISYLARHGVSRQRLIAESQFDCNCNGKSYCVISEVFSN